MSVLRECEEKPNNQVKICSNNHAYDPELDRCPICDSTIIIDKYDSGHDTIICRPIRLINPLTVKLDEQYYFGISHIFVYISRGYKHRYAFSRSGCAFEDDIMIEPEAVIQIGETLIKGKELVKMCDLIIDNHLSFLVHDRFSTTIDVVADHLNPI